MDYLPDIEVIFYMNDSRKTAAFDGYRPSHQINGLYLTSGVHHYYFTGKLEPNSYALGAIKFITPEYYPHCLFVGKTIEFQEGERIVGKAIVLRIINKKLLQKGCENSAQVPVVE